MEQQHLVRSRKTYLHMIVALACGFTAALWAGGSHEAQAQSHTTYSVYCANDKIEVDMRTLEQMKSARGSGTCRFGEFDYLSDAEAFAKKQFGGVGARCSCR